MTDRAQRRTERLKAGHEHLYRFSRVEADSADDAEHTLQVAFASEEPVLRKATEGDEFLGIAKKGTKYWEVLSHNRGDYDFADLDAGAGDVLDEHEDSLQLGKVKRARGSKDAVSRAVLRFDFLSELSKTRFEQMKRGDRQGISTGYWHTGLAGEGDEMDGYPVKRVKWAADEISSVRRPADKKRSGVRRSQDGQWSCISCGNMFDKADLDENYECEECRCEDGTRGEEQFEKLFRDRKALAEKNPPLKPDNHIFNRDAEDEISFGTLTGYVWKAADSDARFKSHRPNGDLISAFRVSDIIFDPDWDIWFAIIVNWYDSQTWKVEFELGAGEVTLSGAEPVEWTGNWKTIERGADLSEDGQLVRAEGNYGSADEAHYADPGYQKDGKQRYPLAKNGKLNKERVRAAWSYLHKEHNAAQYSAEDLAKIKGRIKSAAKKTGVEISDHSARSAMATGGPPVDSGKISRTDNVQTQISTKIVMPKTAAELAAENPEAITELRKQTRATVEQEFQPKLAEAGKTAVLNRTKLNGEITKRADDFIKDHGMKKRGALGESLRKIANEFVTRELGDAGDKQVLAEFGQRCLEEIAKVQPEPYLLRSKASESEYKEYSMLRAIQSICKRAEGGDTHSRLPDKSFELDIHQDMVRHGKESGGLLGSGSDAGGFWVPMDAPTPAMRVARGRDGRIRRTAVVGDRFRRDLYTGDFGSGGALVPTELMTPIIEPLRNWTALDSVNVRFLGGLSGNIVIPRQTGVVAPQAVSEIGALVASQPDFDQISARPRRIGNQTKYSKQLVLQSSPEVEALIRDDNFKEIALLVDQYGIAGTGANSQPLGVLNQPGVASIILGGTATIALLESMKTKIRQANIREPAAYLSTSNVRGRLRSVAAALVNATSVISGQQNAIWTGSDEEGVVCGVPAHDSQQIPNDQIIAGAWDNLIWFQWAGIEVVVDPYTAAGTGEWVITMNTYNDFAVRHPQAFCFSADSAAQ